ncbi:MAG: chloride channel protein [Candidatus Njordarchaeales archaeon]
MAVRRFLITKKVLLFTILIGIIAGIAATAFYLILDVFSWLFLETFAGLEIPQAHGETSLIELELELLTCEFTGFLIIIPAVGGLFSGITVYSTAPEAEGHGTDAVIKAVHSLKGIVRGRVAMVKMIASGLTIGSGGSAGREGPIAQITASIISILTSKIGLSEKEREILVMAAAAAGVGSIFKSPVGGALFGVEVPYKKDYEVEVFVPALIASFIGYAIFSMFVGWQPIFETPLYRFSPLELPLFAMLGIIAGLSARFYVRVFYGVRDWFKKMNIPDHYKPAIGGIVVGLIAFYFPQVLSTGYGWVQLAIYGELAIELMILLVFTKILATSFTIGSGGSGGVFAPSIVIGAMIGGAFGRILYGFFPEIIYDPGIFVLIGMASFFAGAAKVPLTAIIMVAEMTGDYNILAPAILASTLSYIVSGEASIYENQLEYREESPIHLPEIIDSIMEKIRVEEVMSPDLVIVKTDDSLNVVEEVMRKYNQTAVPVVDENGNYVGLLSIYDVLSVPREMRSNTRVGNIIKQNPIYVSPNDSIKKAISLMMENKIFRLPVINYEEKKRLIGCIAYEDIVKMLYYRTLKE